MKIFLVGGAIRDELLGLPVTEHDFVVTGATPNEMLTQGFTSVGKDFPVFLHPQTKEEYALARTERKQGQGYHGFACHFDPNVTLEDDLKRRDLTINAIARDDHGQLIDPYSGLEDLRNRLFKHVSPAFIEDPLRILRVARFAAKLPSFTIHPETQQLMCTMVAQDELTHLSKERFWKEIIRAMAMPQPLRFFEVLKDINAFNILFPQHFDPHEVQNANSSEPIERLAMGYYSCHLEDSLNALTNICAPNELKELVSTLHIIRRHHQNCAHFDECTWMTLASETDLWRRPQRFKTAINLARAHLTNWPIDIIEQHAIPLSQHPWGKDLPKDLKGNDIKHWIHAKKTNYLKQLIK